MTEADRIEYCSKDIFKYEKKQLPSNKFLKIFILKYRKQVIFQSYSITGFQYIVVMELAEVKERRLQIKDEICELKEVVSKAHEMTEYVPLEIIK